MSIAESKVAGRILPLITGGGIGIGAGALADDFVDPVLIWGGNACGDTGSLVQSCGVPPTGLASLLVISIGLVSFIQLRLQ